MNSRLVLALAALTFIALQASSEVSDSTIEAYNNAVQSGSKAELIDAAKALSDEVVASPEADNAALLAFEAGWALCRSGSCEDAISPAFFAKSQPVAAGEHPTAADRELLFSYAEWSVDKNTETRAALDAALVGRVDSPPTLLTVTAFHNRYLNDLSNNRPEEAIKTASAAKRHMAQAKDQLGQLWSGAALAIHTTKFNHEQSPEALIGIAELFAELKLMWHVSSSPSPDWLRDRYYEANAWYSAMKRLLRFRGQSEEGSPTRF
ncbi:hypothetical protein [Henriciella marina]|uniref:hypothetical protein n=1 Tax=Henriciella marina TaxID=453851 RepID=UPI0012EAE135|nr:hypothetical protein [Henriciella marina]